MSNIIASDFGYGYVKVTNGKVKLKFPSLLTRKRKIRYISDITKASTELEKISVKIKNEEFFVGDLAYQQGTEVIQILNKDKFLHKSTDILVGTALGLLAREFKGNPKEFSTITGLPVSACTAENEAKFTTFLQGEHEVEFDWSLINKENQKVTYKIKDVKVVPQPIGTLFDVILDDKGEIKDECLDLAEGSVAIIDIGFGTTDFMIADSLDYIDKFSRSINSAVSNVCGNISNRLSEELGEEIPLYEIQRVLVKKELAIGSKIIDIKDHVDAQVDAVFQEIFTTGQSIWRQKKNINTFLITGGGCHLFYPKFVEALGGTSDIRRPDFDTAGNQIEGVDPSFSNVNGFYKYLLRKNKISQEKDAN